MKAHKTPKEMIVTTEKMVYGGQALARDGRFVVFVDDALPGETVRALLYKKKKNFAFARAVEVLQAAPERIPADCAWVGRCGGCCFRHCAYPAQLACKKDILVEACYGLPAVQALVQDVRPADDIMDYRNKMVFSFGSTLDGEFRLGLHQRGSFIHIIPADRCHLQSEASREIVRRIIGLAQTLDIPPFHEIKKTHGLRQLTIREGKHTGQRMVELVTTARFDGLADAMLEALDDLAGTLILAYDTNLRGTPRPGERHILKGGGAIEETLNGLRFRIGPDTFFQSNTRQAEKMFARLQEWAAEGGRRPATALDLFAGTGAITLHLASRADRVIGVENWAASVAAAEENAGLNGITNVDMMAADVNADLPPGIPEHVELVVVDPPRPGLSPKAIDWIKKLTPDRIIYVSCNPSTLARDLKLFLGDGTYRAEKVEPFDLFPHTYHLETMVLLVRCTGC